jgi:hypothetical protein
MPDSVTSNRVPAILCGDAVFFTPHESGAVFRHSLARRARGSAKRFFSWMGAHSGFAEKGLIFVFQDAQGQSMSEDEFTKRTPAGG